ncbi:hypothetical protein V2S85_12985 [Novosphingobium resinovorum]|nr:hypothetical protein [Novosphingobium resinovorum]
MKANPRSRALPTSPFLVLAIAATAIVAGCVPPPPSAPAPTQTARPPQPRPGPAPALPAAADWRDAPQTPGDWSYTASGAGSAASFGGQFTLQCDPARKAVTLVRSGMVPSGPSALSITTSTGTRALSAAANPRGIFVTLQARDSVLDAMAFSRGRFAVAATGQPTLYLPSWTEISRVLEDCR